MHAFCALTDVVGEVTLALRFVGSDEQVVMSSSPVTIRCEDPLQTIELAIPIPSLPLPTAGWYRLELFADTQRLGTIRIEVSQVG